MFSPLTILLLVLVLVVGGLIGLVCSLLFPPAVAIPLSFVGGLGWGWLASSVALRKGWV